MIKGITSKKKQKGVALFVTLLVVVIATLLATQMWFRNTLDIARTFNNFASYQSVHYAKGMALWASDVLKKDYEVNPRFDNRIEDWNKAIIGFQIENATLSGKLTDMDSKFNLNNLVLNGTANQEAKSYFIRILQNLEIDLNLADKIIDWIDADQEPLPGGAEDSTYLSKSPSYRSAGQYFSHISELRLVDGIDDEIYQRLHQYVTVTPLLGNTATKININTASTLLLKSIDLSISTKEALVLFANGSAHNETLIAFLSQNAIANHGLIVDQFKNLIATKSEWFQAQISVKMGEMVFTKYALISRKSSTPIIRGWSDTPFY